MRKARIHSFAPIAGPHARVLILGSMPGRESLNARQYYAHRQNAFWRIIGALLRLDPSAPYPGRVRALKSAHIAVWDVLQSCVRHGSLDIMIESDTEIANDFRTFFGSHRKITHVFFNGAKAETSFRRHVAGKIGAVPLQYSRLPSTSPANASVPYLRKLEAWRAILDTNQLD